MLRVWINHLFRLICHSRPRGPFRGHDAKIMEVRMRFCASV